VTRRRRQFSPEFKEEAVRMVLEGERTVASVAREFDINASTLGSWVNRHRIESAQQEQPRPVSGPDRARIRELERENAELRSRLETATARTRQMLARVRFLRQQHNQGRDR